MGERNILFMRSLFRQVKVGNTIEDVFYDRFTFLGNQGNRLLVLKNRLKCVV